MIALITCVLLGVLTMLSFVQKQLDDTAQYVTLFMSRFVDRFAADENAQRQGKYAVEQILSVMTLLKNELGLKHA